MGLGNPCDGALMAFAETCDDEVCPKCRQPRFSPTPQQPTFPFNPDVPEQPIQYPTPEFPEQPRLDRKYPYPIQHPIHPDNPPFPIQPFSPQYPIEPIGITPLPLQPTQQPIPPDNTIPPQNILHPIGPEKKKPPPPPGPTTIDPTQGVQWLLYGNDSPGLNDWFVSQGTGVTAGMLALLGGDAPLLASPLFPIAIVVLVATSIAFGIMQLISEFSGRPRLQDTADLARFANSPSPILSAIGKAAARGLALGIPISTSNQAVWASIFGPGINEAYADLQALYPSDTPKQINVLMYILLSEMGHPEQHSPIFIVQLLRDELKQGKIKPPTPTTPAVTQTRPTPHRVVRPNGKITRATTAMVRYKPI